MYSKRRIILALTFLLVLTIPFAADGLPRTIWGEIQGLNIWQRSPTLCS
jgi:hypothetical protein